MRLMMYRKTRGRRFGFVTIVLACITLWIGCTKDPGFEQVGVQLRFINLSPDANTFQVLLNDTKAFTPSLAYNDTTAYLPFQGGTYQVSAQVNSLAPSITVLDFIPKKSYTFFVADSAAKAECALTELARANGRVRKCKD